MYLGNPSRDIILWRDEQHYAAMERGSLRLRHAVEDYYLAKMRHRPIGRAL